MVSCVCSASVFVNCMGAGWVFLGELLFGFWLSEGQFEGQFWG
jgi:hypothetical protein